MNQRQVWIFFFGFLHLTKKNFFMNQHQQQTTKQAIGVFDMAPFPLTGGLRKWRGTNRQFPEGKVSPFLFECYFKL